MSPLGQHNAFQRKYFATSNKKTMRLVDTPYLRRHVEKAIEFAAIKPHDKIIEIGCGMGRYTALLARAGYRVSGFDLTPELLESLKLQSGPEIDISLYQGDIHSPPQYLEGMFDVVAGFFTLHHLFDLEAALIGARRLLRPRGRVIFLEPNPFNPLYYLQIALTPGMTWAGDCGILNMTYHKVTTALNAAGYRDLCYQAFGFFPPIIANLPGGQSIERIVEKFPPFKPILPFQLFSAAI